MTTRMLKFRRWLAERAFWLLSPDGNSRMEIRANEGAELSPLDGCEDTDEVVGYGFLHVEQMDNNLYWARLDTPLGDDVVMWFSSESRIKLTAYPD